MAAGARALGLAVALVLGVPAALAMPPAIVAGLAFAATAVIVGEVATRRSAPAGT